METVTITGPFIKLDSLLKFTSLVSSGGEAKTVIADGLVGVNGETCLMRGKKIYPGDRVSFCGAELLVKADEDT